MRFPRLLLGLASVAVTLWGPAGYAETAAAGPDRGYTFRRGVNLSHWFAQNSAARPYAAPWFTAADLEWIAAQGFDHIRLPVDVRECIRADGTLDPARLQPIHHAIGWCRERGLGVVLDAHFLPGADFNARGGDTRVFTDLALQARVAALWRDLAARFRDEGPWLRFEILNEPVAAENRQLNPFQRRMLAAIRETNPTRIVYLTSNRWSQFASVGDLELPDDPDIALDLHTYEPFVFTHQRAPWTGFKPDMPAVHFPGPLPDLQGYAGTEKVPPAGTALNAARIDAAFEQVDAWRRKTRPRLEIYVGEFGVYQTADRASARRWIRTIVGECQARGWSWAVWDYRGGFAVRGPDGHGTAILEALFRAEPTDRPPP